MYIFILFTVYDIYFNMLSDVIFFRGKYIGGPTVNDGVCSNALTLSLIDPLLEC